MKFEHPAFLPYQGLIEALDLATALPSLDALNEQAARLDTTQAKGLPVRFFSPDGRLSARDYETHILESGEVPTRADTWHDILNALVWLRFPRFKAALNAAHGEAMATETESLRGRRRDALTVLDESGVWVVSPDAALQAMLSERAWKPLFDGQRRAVETRMCFVVVGHALLEKTLAPYPSMTGKCLMLESASLELEAAEALAVAALGSIDTPKMLAPLPIQGIPGWDPANEAATYYDNLNVFRPAPARPLPAGLR